jgi:hypothetical protein
MIDTNQEKHTEVFSGSRSPKWVMTEDGQEKKSLFLFFCECFFVFFFFDPVLFLKWDFVSNLCSDLK